MKKLSLLLLLCLASQACQAQPKPRNVIFMIGDGMGPAYTSGYRYYKDNPQTEIVETTVFDRLLVGTASTYPDDDTYVTDSAASATALATGVKSFNGAIGINAAHQPLDSLLKHAKRQGKDTAIVVTSEINHATPASFVAHNESRRNKDAIADHFIDNKVDGKPVVDLLLGGGQAYFARSDRNLVREFQQFGYQSVSDLQQLHRLTRLPAIGLFADTGLPRAIDSDTPHRLSTMTEQALHLLKKSENESGFFLMIEGSQIDWCGHANDIACAMHEMDDFARSIEVVEKFIQENPDTLLVVTADHSTGGLSLAATKDYRWQTDIVSKQKRSLAAFVGLIDEDANLEQLWQDNFGYALAPKDKAVLQEHRNDHRALYETTVKISSKYSNTGWTTSGHDAVDVQVFSTGKGHNLFRGFQDNTEISQRILLLMDGNPL